MVLIKNYEVTEHGTIKCKCGHEEKREIGVWKRCPRCFRRYWYVKMDKKEKDEMVA